MPRFFLGPDPHARTRELIPWVINGRATAEQCSGVRAHLDECAACREDYAAQEQLYRVMHEEGSVVFAPEGSFQKLLARIEGGSAAPGREPAPPAARAAARSGGSSRTVRYLAAAVVVQALGLGFTAWLLNSQNRQLAPRYFTQTQPDAADFTRGARVRAVFAPGITLEALQRLLRSCDARIIDGPTEAGVYTLGFAPSSVATELELAARLKVLRADPGVRFAEPLATGVPP